MVHSAFQAVCLVPESEVKVESVVLWEERLLVGCLDGSLHVYGPSGADSTQAAPYVLLDKRVGFGKKSIIQMDVLQARALLISLSDGISVHTLPELELVTHLYKTRGATLYSLNLEHSLLSVALKRKLLIYSFDNGKDFTERGDLIVPDTVHAMTWAGEDAICIGFGRQYSLVNVQTKALADVFPAGRVGRPVVTGLPDKELLLSKDNIGVSVDLAGKPTRTGGLSWSEPPASVTASPPYVLARLTRFLEVRSLRPPHHLVQTLPLRGMTMLTSAPAGRALVANDRTIYSLQPVEVAAQITQLMSEACFEDALLLCQQLQGEEAASRPDLERSIRGRYAEHLFQKEDFDAAMAQYAKVPLNLSAILSHFPSIKLPPSEASASTAAELTVQGPVSREGSLSPTALNSPLAGATLARALKALADLLALKRPEVVSAADQHRSGVSSHEQATVLDTALLQALLATDSVKPAHQLLEGPNFCHVALCEPLLSGDGHFEELSLLYKSHGMHRETLGLLKQRAESDPALEYEPLAVYLKQLGSRETALVLEYSVCLLEAHPQAGLALFKDMDPPIPPQTVLAHLRTHAPQLSAAYLEHVLGGSPGSQLPSLATTPQKLATARSSSFGGDSYGGETTPPSAKTPIEEEGLSSKLVHLYLERVVEEAKKESWGERARSETRQKLLSLLDRSTAYDAKQMLSELPDGVLLYERALLLGKLGKHQQALAIFARGLGDTLAAEEYCERFHEAGHNAGGINGSIGADTGAVVSLSLGNRVDGGMNRKQEPESVNMFLTLLEVYVDPQVGTSVKTLLASSNDDSSPETEAQQPASPLGSDVEVFRGVARKPKSTPRSARSSGASSPHSSGSEESKQVYKEVSINQEVMIDAALQLLEKYWDRIDGAKAVRLLPSNVDLRRLVPFLEPLFRRISEGRRNAAVVKNLRRTENLQVHSELLHERRRSFRVLGKTACTICHKKIGTSVFAMHPDNRLVHFSCYKEAQPANVAAAGV